MFVRITIFIALFCALHGAGWVASGILLKSAVENWIEAQTKAGYLVRHSEAEARITGYPFKVTARLQDVVLAQKIDKPDLIWQMEHLDLSIIPLPFIYDTLKFEATSRHTITSPHFVYVGKPIQFEGAFDWTAAGGFPDFASLTLSGFEAVDKMSGKKIFMDQVSFSAGLGEGDKYDYSLKAAHVDLFRPLRGIGGKVQEVIFRGHISQKNALQKIDADTLTAWRDLGGVVEIDRVKIALGPLDMQGNGTLALDGGLQPVGTLTARFQGFFQTVDLLSRTGIISGPNASLAKVVLGALAKRPENGGPLTISLPMTIQERGFYAGPVRLADFPKIDW